MKINIILILIFTAYVMSGCESCSKSGRDNIIGKHKSGEYSINNKRDRSSKKPKNFNSNTVKMSYRNGVYYVPIKVNGVEMEFIFDTGAADIMISAVESAYLAKQGKLTEDDIVGASLYEIADGSVVSGIQIILKEVQIANKTLHNVKASVMLNIDAPLLLGQSALSKYGKISIDYENEIIEFE